jgi:pantoate--beta-alanine ligase
MKEKYYHNHLILMEHQMEGKFRPGHFDGDSKKDCLKLNPTNAYFGEKIFSNF